MNPSLFEDTNAFKADFIIKGRIISLYFKVHRRQGACFFLRFRFFNVDRYTFPIRITILVQARKTAYFSKTSWNL